MNSDTQIPTCEVALVTGAGRGIGRAIAIGLAQTGRFVYINFKSNAKEAQNTLDMVRQAGGDGSLIPFDVTDEKATAAALKTIYKDKGFIDILVNNAGIREDTLMAWMKFENWQQVLDTNLTGFFNVTKPVVKKMVSRQKGRIINMASTSGQTGQSGQVNYSASKAGLIGATKALAREIATRQITVNAVAPGFIGTDMVDGISREKAIETIPMGRLGLPEEVAATVVFLCSPLAGYITGQVIGINGGIC